MLTSDALAEWTRRDSFLHRRDARAKLAALVVVLIAIATAPQLQGWELAAYASLLLLAVLGANLPLPGVLSRAAVVLPFAGAAAAFVALSQGIGPAAFMLARSYVSTLAVVVVAATTPAPQLFSALSWFRCPRPLVLTAQFLYRFLFVAVEQAARMRLAARCRSGPGRDRRSLRAAAAGSIATLFASAYSRAERIHRAMLARGFDGEIRTMAAPRIAFADWMLFIAAAGLALAVRFH